MTKKIKNQLSENRVIYNFYEICKIPHPSFGEQELSDYLFRWAKNLGLEVIQDKQNNILIKKESTEGYQDKRVILLQAHLDMVCEKKPDYKHDFLLDSIPIQMNGDTLSTDGKTTLGADNGIGVAMAMAILESDAISHPSLEVLFTTAEEEDMSGAMLVDGSLFAAKQLINLDHSVENEVIAGSCGGMGINLTIPVEKMPYPCSDQAFNINISGFKGGHSGLDIHRGWGNANIILSRLLLEIRKNFHISLAELCGGNFRLAIPREANAVITINPENAEVLNVIVERFQQEIKKEYLEFNSSISIVCKETSVAGKVVGSNDLDRIISAIILSPNGVQEINSEMGVVDSSCNLGELCLLDDRVELVYELRATRDSAKTYIYEKIKVIARLLDGIVNNFAQYPGWAYNPQSALRSLTQKTYKDLFGAEMQSLVVHCGLECGCLCDKIISLDAISIGPDILAQHSPTESVSVASIEQTFELLCEVLKRS